ncbi:MAG TPA: uroporphyrinogen decarboxylase family protein [Bacteroidota bacterium]|nr:uroporphyrinogen decarboxylase family protein [Bacteroidota bacterium]
MTPRERVRAALLFTIPDRVPRDLWTLPWAEKHFPADIAALLKRYPPDIVTAPSPMLRSPRLSGDQYTPGTYTDEWGCVFRNIQEGAIGEVKDPIIPGIDMWRTVAPPYETFPPDRERAIASVNAFCMATDAFVLSEACPRPWERYQFLRGSVNALMDVATMEPGTAELLAAIHRYYMDELDFWTSTLVDGVKFMDDWGSQRQLLISPATWRSVFKPLYREYAELAHERGKFIFMHSDGNIEEILPDLAEIGIDAVNSQLFCMDLERVAREVKGRITFWGEIDRQHVLPAADPDAGRKAVRDVAARLYDSSGGVIAQLEFGLAANPAVVAAIYDEWERVGAPGTRYVARGDPATV